MMACCQHADGQEPNIMSRSHLTPYSQSNHPTSVHSARVVRKPVLIELATWAISRGKGWVVHQVHAAIVRKGLADD
jgi:hypothetical protein